MQDPEELKLWDELKTAIGNGDSVAATVCAQQLAQLKAQSSKDEPTPLTNEKTLPNQSDRKPNPPPHAPPPRPTRAPITQATSFIMPPSFVESKGKDKQDIHPKTSSHIVAPSGSSKPAIPPQMLQQHFATVRARSKTSSEVRLSTREEDEDPHGIFSPKTFLRSRSSSVTEEGSSSNEPKKERKGLTVSSSSSLFGKTERKEFFSEDARVESFVLWPFLQPKPQQLAEAGFFFAPKGEKKDECRCYACGLKLSNWLPTDDPREEHRRWKPTCKVVQSWSDPTVASALAEKAAKYQKGKPKKETTESTEKTSEKPADISAVVKETPEQQAENLREKLKRAETAAEGLEKLASFYGNDPTAKAQAEKQLEDQRQYVQTLTAKLQELTGESKSLGTASQRNSQRTSQPGSQRTSMNEMLGKRDSNNMSDSSKRGSVQSDGEGRKQGLGSKRSSTSGEEVVSDRGRASSRDDVWTQYRTEEGFPYWHNNATGVTTWDSPRI